MRRTPGPMQHAEDLTGGDTTCDAWSPAVQTDVQRSFVTDLEQRERRALTPRRVEDKTRLERPCLRVKITGELSRVRSRASDDGERCGGERRRAASRPRSRRGSSGTRSTMSWTWSPVSDVNCLRLWSSPAGNDPHAAEDRLARVHRVADLHRRVRHVCDDQQQARVGSHLDVDLLVGIRDPGARKSSHPSRDHRPGLKMNEPGHSPDVEPGGPGRSVAGFAAHEVVAHVSAAPEHIGETRDESRRR